MSGRFLAAASLALAALLGTCPGAALAQAAQITHLSGTVAARGADGSTRLLSVNSAVNEGDLLVTAENTFARMKFSDGGEVVLRPSSQLKLESYRFEDQTPERDNFAVALIKGGFRSITGLLARRNAGKVSYGTPTATIGIRGTHFGALVCNNDCEGIITASGAVPANGTHVDVADGAITLTTRLGTLVLAVGEFGFAESLDKLPEFSREALRITLPRGASNLQIQGGTVGVGSEQECRIASN